MGCDGGTIPKRDELVKTKKKPEQKDAAADNAAKWSLCAISQQSLAEPIVACELGRLYSKENVIRFLLDRNEFGDAPAFAHLRSLKDVHELKLSRNPEPSADPAYPYICPIAGIEMNGKFGFFYFVGCGCVLSEKALKAIGDDTATQQCPVCGGAATKGDQVPLNVDESSLPALRDAMEQRRAAAKLLKKKQKRALNAASVSSEPVATETAAKRTRAQAHDAAALPSTSAAGCVRAPDIADACRPLHASIQKDPSASEVFKGLFTSHQSAADAAKRKAHWVTMNPFYY